MISLMPYIGGKHRMAKEIAERLHATGADCLVDVFGGSAAVTLNSGFKKRVYNDASGDLVNLFRVLQVPENRVRLFRLLRNCPVSRRIFLEDYAIYRSGAYSFIRIQDPIDRARATLYRQLLAFGGKGRCGGFSPSSGDQERYGIKEVKRYTSVLRKLSAVGEYFRNTCIENLDYRDCISIWGRRSNVVLFCDPPYDGTERYYSHAFTKSDHVILASLLSQVKASVVVTYYDSPLIQDLYPLDAWNWERVTVTKNCQLKKGNKPKMDELILTRISS